MREEKQEDEEEEEGKEEEEDERRGIHIQKLKNKITALRRWNRQCGTEK